MKLSKVPTKYIIVKAGVSGNDDILCNCAIVYLNEDFESIISTFNKIAPEINNKRFYRMNFWYHCVFMNLDEEQVNPDIVKFLECEEEDYVFLNTNEKDLEQFYKTVEDRVHCTDTHQLCISEDTVYWKAYGKYSGEEYSTNEILTSNLENIPPAEKIKQTIQEKLEIIKNL